MLENPPQEKQLKNLPFWEVGLFEFGFVVVILVLLFGILNYFNILSISDAFPKQLGWLPHQTPSQTTKNIPNSPTTSAISYDSQNAKMLLTQYIKDNLKPGFAPNNPMIEQNESMYTSRFKVQSAYISAYFKYQTNTKNLDYMRIFVALYNIKESTLTSDLANSLISTYFTAPSPLTSICKTGASQTYCESFNQEVTGKRGFGVVFGSNADGPYKNTYTCFAPKESESFQNRQSCLAF